MARLYRGWLWNMCSVRLPLGSPKVDDAVLSILVDHTGWVVIAAGLDVWLTCLLCFFSSKWHLLVHLIKPCQIPTSSEPRTFSIRSVGSMTISADVIGRTNLFSNAILATKIRTIVPWSFWLLDNLLLFTSNTWIWNPLLFSYSWFQLLQVWKRISYISANSVWWSHFAPMIWNLNQFKKPVLPFDPCDSRFVSSLISAFPASLYSLSKVCCHFLLGRVLCCDVYPKALWCNELY